MYVQNQPISSQNHLPAFKGHTFGPFKVESSDEFMADYILDEQDFEIEDAVMDKKQAEALRNHYAGVIAQYEAHKKEQERIFREHLKPDCVASAEKLVDLPTYDTELLPFLIDKKNSELEYLHEIATKKDSLGEMRIPGCTLPFFSEIPVERLKMLEPIITSKNDAGMWNYGPSFILDLDEKYSDKQIYIMSQLADCKVNGKNLRDIAGHPTLNHKKTIEKARELNMLFGKDLREIEFFSNRNGENWLSADIQLPHRDDKPDWLNFQRVFSRLDDDVNPLAANGVAKEVDKYVDDIYARLEDKMHIFGEQDLDNAIKEVKVNNPDAKEEEILRTMQKLTQFANYSSLGVIENTLQSDNRSGVLTDIGINPCVDYLTNKKIIKLDKTQKLNKAVFVTKQDLDNPVLKKLIKNAKEFGDKIEFINLEGWSDGVNLLSDDTTLAERTNKVLKKAKKIEAKNPQYTFKDALEHALNKEIESKFKDQGCKIKTISINAPATKETILEQMHPSMPTKSILKSTIASVSKFYTKDNPKEFSNTCQNVAQYYDENIRVFSKQGIIESLKQIHDGIDEYLSVNDLNKDNLYFISPKTKESKSFDIIGKMYSDLYNVPQEKFLKVDGIGALNSYSDNSTFVVLDDVAGSGTSMADLGEYNYYGRTLGKDKHILFCPITATSDGINYLNECIEDNERNNSDKVIYLKNNCKDYSKVKDNFINNGKESLNETIFGNSGHGQYGMCTVFPYMAPDNNSDLSAHIIKFFVPTHDCIKRKDENLSQIEENTLYFDIFGTDKEHIETNAHKVYNPKQKNRILAIFNMF